MVVLKGDNFIQVTVLISTIGSATCHGSNICAALNMQVPSKISINYSNNKIYVESFLKQKDFTVKIS